MTDEGLAITSSTAEVRLSQHWRRPGLARGRADQDLAFYPSAAAIRAELDAETPAWKQRAWPLDIETLSGMFDFNRAPFYQCFMEVRVERSKEQVLLLLHGVNGPVRW